jgi:hypothetical protein
MVGRGGAWFGMAWYGLGANGTVIFLIGFGTARRGVARSGWVWWGSVGLGAARIGMAWAPMVQAIFELRRGVAG